MTTFRVWAPLRQNVALLLDGQRHRMTRQSNRWWTTEVRAEGGQAYQYEFDGGDVCPDPRSQFQPAGVQGASRLVGISSFRWNDQGFQSRPLSSALVYELHVGTFSSRGTFEGMIEHLDHLVRLGVTHVELMPIAEYAGARGWGYDGVFPFAPHHAYGGPKGHTAPRLMAHVRVSFES
jgi:maltooligosyltrehalose trehalohydrolase